MKINDKDFILLVESLRSVRALLDLNSPYTANIRVDRDEIIELTNRLVDHYQATQDGEPTTADEFNTVSIKDINKEIANANS